MAQQILDSLPPDAPPGLDAQAPASRIHRMLRSAELWVPVGVLVLIAAGCFFWPLVYTLPNPTTGSLLGANLPPLSIGHLLGTDGLGNDELSQVLYGGRVSLEVGFGAVGIGLVLGGGLGMTAAIKGHAIEAVIMRVLEVFLAFPSLVLALTISSYLGQSEWHVIIAIAFFIVPAMGRIARAGTLRLRESNFITAARLSGVKDNKIVLKHVVPNVLPQLLTFSLLAVAIAIIVEAALDFLGAGIPSPTPSWGRMISAGQASLTTQPYLVLVPSAFLFATILCLNAAGDAFRARSSAR